jgi:hypothetical protein
MSDKEVRIQDTDSLAHTKWICKYHIVFAPKFRRRVIYGMGVPHKSFCFYGVKATTAVAPN